MIEVPEPRPRTTDQFLSPEFLATKRRLEALVHPAKAADGVSYRLEPQSGDVL